jgi:sn-glycerol 3-phosphate transport system ATP-binding protein
MASISLRNVVKRYGNSKTGLQVIHGVNAEVADGEFIVIVGPSGCGKSTLLRMVAGLEEVSGGEICIGPRVVNDLEPAERDIAMVFQNYALYPHMSVFENMAYGLKIAKVPPTEIQARVDKAAKILEIGPFLQRKPRELSGAPSCASPRCFCLTSRCPIWTPNCARRPVWKFRNYTANSASPLCL